MLRVAPGPFLCDRPHSEYLLYNWVCALPSSYPQHPPPLVWVSYASFNSALGRLKKKAIRLEVRDLCVCVCMWMCGGVCGLVKSSIQYVLVII